MGMCVTGQIYFRIDDKFFPEEGWSDLLVNILKWWVYEFLSARDSRLDFYFMDGPYMVKFIPQGNHMYKVNFVSPGKNDEDEVYITAETNQKDLHKILLKACRKALRVLEQAEIPRKEYETLRNLFQDLKNYKFYE